MRARSWPWLKTRITGLFQVRSRVMWEILSDIDRDAINERLMRGGHPLPWG